MTFLESMATSLDWADEVLDAKVLKQVGEIVQWAAHSRSLRTGYRCLFHGPVGRGQRLAAALLAQACSRPAYRIDLSKAENLDSAFERAAREGAILFFDEADALFGKRTQSRNANDRAANQQVAYLLQRIEDFPGIVILATNIRSHLDDAFARRFQSVIRFRARASSRARRAARPGR